MAMKSSSGSMANSPDSLNGRVTSTTVPRLALCWRREVMIKGALPVAWLLNRAGSNWTMPLMVLKYTVPLGPLCRPVLLNSVSCSPSLRPYSLTSPVSLSKLNRPLSELNHSRP